MSDESQPPDVEFETFEIPQATNRAWGSKYSFLTKIPKGAHCHFRDPPKFLRSSIGQLNRQLDGSGMHFGVYEVGVDDPKGPGFRVIRDDRPIRRSAKKP